VRNVAHLVLAGMLERRGEIVIREALGATSWHLIRQVLTESLLLAGIGGAVGAGLAVWIGEFLRKLAQDQIPRMDESSFSGPVWQYTIAIALLCGLLFASPASVGPVVNTVNRRRVANSPRFCAVLIPAEIALGFVVLTGAALLARSFAAVLNEDPGFHAENVLAMDVPSHQYLQRREGRSVFQHPSTAVRASAPWRAGRSHHELTPPEPALQ
jgi:putative ABC transport system permease protein